MEEIEIRNKDIESIEKIGEIEAENKLKSKKILKPYKSSSKSVKGLVLGLIQKFSGDAKKGITYSPLDLQKIFEEVLHKFNELYPNKIIKIEIIEGWEKDNGDFPVWKDFNNDFVVEIWHKDGMEKKKVEKADLNRMLIAIRKMKIGENYKCYAIARFLGYDWKTVWKERMEIYFPRYYIPLKVLDKLGIVRYGGNKKSIIRLK